MVGVGVFAVGDGADAGYGGGEDLGFVGLGDEVNWVECHVLELFFIDVECLFCQGMTDEVCQS